MPAKKESSSKSYNRLKQDRGGGGYSGMQIGRSHKWLYDQGEWRERKVTPDEWEIFYQTTKRRTARAPEESGAPIGTEYNWLIVSHQRVDKLDANSYMTCMEGKKFKVAHKRADKNKWSATEKTQRKQVIQYLEKVIEELKQADEAEQVPYSIGEHDRVYGLSLRTKAELYEMAKEYNVPSPSKLSRDELLEAVKERLDGRPDDKPTETAIPELGDKPKDDLYRMAKERNIGGRSDMNKTELLSALQKDIHRAEPRAL